MLNQSQINCFVFAAEHTLAPELAKECISAFAQTINELTELKKKTQEQKPQETKKDGE